jgi:nitroreductase
METYQAIKSRRTIRKFKDVEVPWEYVIKLLEAGKSAPSSGNIQNWKFIVIRDTDQKKELAEMCGNQHWIARAPVLIAVVADVDKAKRFYGIRGDRLYSIQNCAAAATNMLIMANDLGLGGAWVGYMDEEKVSTVLTLTPNMRPQVILAIGYPDEDPPCPPKYTLETVMYFRQFGGQGNRIDEIYKHTGDYSYTLKKGIDKVREVGKKINDVIMGNDEDDE